VRCLHIDGPSSPYLKHGGLLLLFLILLFLLSPLCRLRPCGSSWSSWCSCPSRPGPPPGSGSGWWARGGATPSSPRPSPAWRRSSQSTASTRIPRCPAAPSSTTSCCRFDPPPPHSRHRTGGVEMFIDLWGGFQEPCETSRALEMFISFHAKASGYIGPANPGYGDAASMLSRGWNKVGFLRRRGLEGLQGFRLVIHLLLSLLLPRGLVPVGVRRPRAGRRPEPPDLRPLGAEAQRRAAEPHPVLQVGQRGRHLLGGGRLGGDGH